MITPFPPSPTPETNPHYPLRTPQTFYWYYPFPLGCEPETDRRDAEVRYAELKCELAPLLTGRMNVLTALQVLDDLIYPCALAFSFDAMMVWMRHAQEVITAIKLYAFMIPLKREEKHLIVNFALYWSQKRGGACDMGRPETQIVLSTMMEMAQFGHYAY